tara:strand:- start:428 stop:787 length:360 start_codon:yes stop_codon:yes gene_type:complete
MAKKEFPEIKEKNQGKFTKWVENNMSGKTTCKAASIIVSKNKKEEEKGIKPNKRTYKPAVLKMANYANNFGCKTEGKSKGATAMKEGPMANKFIGELIKARKEGRDSFVVDGKTHKVKK